MTKIKTLAVALTAILLPLLSVGTTFATPRISPDQQVSNLNQGDSEVITITLNEPIICEDPDAPFCGVVLDFSSSDTSSVSLDNADLTWTESDWYVPQEITVTALAPSNCASSETDTISATAVSAAEFYNNFQTSFSVTINAQTPYSPPTLTSQNISLVNNGGSNIANALSGSDNCPDPSSLTIVSGPSHGTAVDPAGYITYTPQAGYSGQDSLTFQVCSLLAESTCSTSTLTYNITAEETPDTGYGRPQNTEKLSLAIGISATTLLSIGAGLSINNRRKQKRHR